ncbi:BMP family ABC transporter substrate-binding protein [Spirochaetia bacterium 38H-sp]|uniref:BMP family ABC transporter substrate-binding protein n=1 Tax=Rarispira pelagica TaxID=3141764 RepID=A0ABU9UCM9_9SPIR
MVSCSGKKQQEASNAPDFKVGLVTDVGGIDDRSFNQGTWEGIVRFGKELGLKEGVGYKYLQSSSEADYVPNLSTFADEGLDLIAAPGFLFTDAMTQVAQQNPDKHFLIIDTFVELPNVVSAVFAEHEGSFLVGVAAALKAKADGKDTVGFIGGMKFPLIEKFEAGYTAGVKAVYPECNILVDYAGDFAAPDKGQALAIKQYNAGAYVIFHAAGATGNGLIKEAKERSKKGDIVWAIGVDKDQYQDGIYDGDKSAILTSMVKRVDIAAYSVAKMAYEGKFPGGKVLVFSLKNKGVGIPENNPNLSTDIVNTIKDYAAKIASGEIVVPDKP